MMVRRAFSLLYIDVDGLASINERFGYAFGDRLLGQLWDRLRAAASRKGGLVRVCDDEFILLLETGGDAQQTASVAEHMLACARDPIRVESEVVEASVSIGGALYPQHGDDIHALMTRAETAMRQVKAQGRGGFRMFEAAVPEPRLPRHLLSDLYAAVNQREFVLYYQPQLSAAEDRITGAEALLRWQHPRLGLLSPDHFIDTLEQSRLIVPLGEWVLDEACRQAAAWRAAGRDWTMSVNISLAQLADRDFPGAVRRVLDCHGLPPASITLELTESIGMQDAAATIPRLRTLSDLGVGISIDDFGTGYSSLLYLSTLPATELKIDRGFVLRLWEDGHDAYIVSTIVALGHALGLTVVAEGVETTEQHQFLTSLGCDVLQGYHFGPPLRSDRFWSRFAG